MDRRPNPANDDIAATRHRLAFAVALALALSPACGAEEPPPRTAMPALQGAGGDDGGGGEGGTVPQVTPDACDDGEVRECKVQIDENNCFIGDQQCWNETWGDCLDAGTFDDPT